MNLFNLEGKTALITGGIHGLGMAMAEGLAKAGAELIITNNIQEPLDVAIEQYKKSGFKVQIPVILTTQFQFKVTT